MSIEDDIKRILLLKDNFDSEGGRPPKKETLDKAVKIIPRIKEFILSGRLPALPTVKQKRLKSR